MYTPELTQNKSTSLFSGSIKVVRRSSPITAVLGFSAIGLSSQ